MKKKDVKLGVEYFSCSRQDWQVSTWDSHRVRILDLDIKKWRWTGNSLVLANFHGAGSTGMRAMRLHPETGQEMGETVVTLVSLRGEWAETIKAVTEAQDNRNKRKAEQDARDKARKDRLGVILAKARQWLGISTYSPLLQENYGKQGTVVVDMDLFNAMVTELDKQGWKYEKA